MQVTLPRLSARTLWSPLGRGALCLAAALVPPLLLNVVIVPVLMPQDASFVPTFDFVQDAIAATLLASIVVVLVAVWQRVRPSWNAMRLPTKIGYVLAVVAAQLTLTAGAEAALWESRGGLQLFRPRLESMQAAPDGRMAFVYKDTFLTCRYDVKQAAPLSLAMRPAMSVSRASCNEPLPTVDFKPDGTVDLLGADEKHLEPQTPSNPFAGLFWHGC